MSLEKLKIAGWADVMELGISSWLWLDMDDDGLHRGQLPDAQPAQLTHAWGWSDTRLVRLRFDRDLPVGVVGAQILVRDAGMPQQVSVWPNRDKIRMSSHAFHDADGAPTVRLESFAIPAESRTLAGGTRVPITFYRIAEWGAG